MTNNTNSIDTYGNKDIAREALKAAEYENPTNEQIEKVANNEQLCLNYLKVTMEKL